MYAVQVPCSYILQQFMYQSFSTIFATNPYSRYFSSAKKTVWTGGATLTLSVAANLLQQILKEKEEEPG